MLATCLRSWSFVPVRVLLIRDRETRVFTMHECLLVSLNKNEKKVLSRRLELAQAPVTCAPATRQRS